jgi:hypothetical protein
MLLRNINKIYKTHVNLDIVRIACWYWTNVYEFGIFSTNGFTYNTLILEKYLSTDTSHTLHYTAN